ncbi:MULTISPECIES: hypothetical protein [Mycobacterium]|uniref:hypothetical protein n=1 Tax=Mycobacterium TaxID=1763 RepID=UPI000FAFD191|nr:MULTISPECIES: hypothetical protein [Mycobacterium]RUP01075.1 MAG: hypothetical protein EKK34_31000 [Mycobacterium sp.]
MAATYAIRDDVIWPRNLVLPPRPPALVYLDMLGWINMAEVDAGNTAPAGYARVLEACRRARSEGRALFPLSSTAAIELYNIADVSRRRARVAVMEQLSGFSYLLGRPQLQRLEVESAFDELPGVSIPSRSPIGLIGPSLLWAFGMRGGLITNAPDADAIARQICQGIGIDPGNDAWASLELWAERALLTGPDDHEDPQLQAAGYSLAGWRNILTKRAEQEQELVTLLNADPALRQGNLRDVVGAREMSIELLDVINTAIAGTSASAFDEIDRTQIRDISDRMPSTRVAVSLKTIYHKNAQHVWTPNDIHDIDALSVAVPYCDIVFTDKAMRDKVISCRELSVFKTEMPRKPDDLADVIDALPSAGQ